MPVTAVDLGTVTACRIQKPHAAGSSLSLALSTSFAIDLPSDLGLGSPDINPEASQIARACKEGTLWVSKSGSCRLDFAAILVDGEGRSLDADPNSIIDQTTLSRICSSIADFRIWQDIRLRLRDRHPDESHHNPDIPTSEETDNQVQASSSYFLHHPDLSSDIHAPPSVPCARFHGLTCQIKLRFNNSANHDTSDFRQRRKGKRNGSSLPNGTTPPIEGSEEKTKETTESPFHRGSPENGYNLRHGTRRASGEVAGVESLGPGTVLEGHPLPAYGASGGRRSKRREENIEVACGGKIDNLLEETKTPPRRDALSESSSEDIARGVEELLDAALMGLIGVGKRGTKGIRVVRNVGQPSLIEIAPAVWNLRYLQSVTAHANLIPSMANSLARLGNSKSASLREKIGRITGKQQCEQDETVGEITQRLWRLCQTGIRARPVPRGGGSKTITREVVPHEPAASRHSFEHQETRMMIFPGQWERYGEYVQPVGTVSYGDFAGQAPIESFQDGAYDMEGNAVDSDPEFWQAEWLGPHDSEMDEEVDGFSESVSYSGSYSESEMDGFVRSSADETEGSEAEKSVGEYFYADGQGNVFPIGFEESECSEESHYQGSLESDWDDSASFVSEDREEGSKEGESDGESNEDVYLAVEQYPDQQDLWHHYQGVAVGSSVDMAYW